MKNRDFWISLAGAAIFVALVFMSLTNESVKEQEFVFPKITLKSRNLGQYFHSFSSSDKSTYGFFRVSYIGKWKKKIDCDPSLVVCPYWIYSRTDFSSGFPEATLQEGNPKYTQDDDFDIVPYSDIQNMLTPPRLFIDTTHNLSGQFQENAYPKVYPVILQNTTSSRKYLGSNDEITLELQRYTEDHWENVYTRLFEMCGTGKVPFFLPPGEIAVTLLPLPDKPGPYRLFAVNAVSNTFR
jgi:hypothetical protein